MSSSAPSDELPPWQVKLLAVPPERRSGYQRDLIRGLELADLVKKDLERALNTSNFDTDLLTTLLTSLEAVLLGPFSLSALFLHDIEVVNKLSSFASDVFDNAINAYMHARNNLNEEDNTYSVNYGTSWAVLLSYVNCVALGLSFPLKKPLPYVFELQKFLIGILDRAQPGLNEFLTQTGSTLTSATIRDAVVTMFNVYNFASPEGGDYLEKARQLVNEVLVPSANLQDPLPLWKVFAINQGYFTFLRPFAENQSRAESAWGVQLDSSAEGREMAALAVTAVQAFNIVMERAVAAAEAAGDDARLAFCAAKRAHAMILAIRPIAQADIKAMADKAVAALDPAKEWLPRTHRITMSIDHVVDMLQNAPCANERLLHAGLYALTGRDIRFTEFAVAHTNPPRSVPVRNCSYCNAMSRELKTCSRCCSAYYCGPSCQRAHWKNGHKVECAQLKAAAEAAAAAGEAETVPAAAEAETAAAGTSASASGTSTGSSKKKNKSKKKG